jgi:hypothetical protein
MDMVNLAGGEILADLMSTLRTVPMGWPMFSMREVVEHGRLYVGRSRPKGYRKQAAKKCFYNAGRFALDDRGIYVEGYASHRGNPVHHAWVTLDGVHATDVRRLCRETIVIRALEVRLRLQLCLRQRPAYLPNNVQTTTLCVEPP